MDLTLVKAFGLPKAPVLGENARIELRVDAYNIFNNLNLNRWLVYKGLKQFH